MLETGKVAFYNGRLASPVTSGARGKQWRLGRLAAHSSCGRQLDALETLPLPHNLGNQFQGLKQLKEAAR